MLEAISLRLGAIEKYVVSMCMYDILYNPATFKKESDHTPDIP